MRCEQKTKAHFPLWSLERLVKNQWEVGELRSGYADGLDYEDFSHLQQELENKNRTGNLTLKVLGRPGGEMKAEESRVIAFTLWRNNQDILIVTLTGTQHQKQGHIIQLLKGR